MPKYIVAVYNYRKILKRLNKKNGTNISFTQLRMLVYMKFNGATAFKNLLRLGGGWTPTTMKQIPELLAWGYIQDVSTSAKVKKYDITTDGLLFLDLYERKLKICRNDRIS